MRTLMTTLTTLGMLATGAPAVAAAESLAVAGSLLVVQHTSYCMTVRGASRLAGAKIEQRPCSATARHQRWNVINNGGMTYKYINVNSGLCMEVAAASTVRGAHIVQGSCNDGLHQRFVVDISKTWSVLMVRRPNAADRCVSVYGGSLTSGTMLIQWSCDWDAHQLWDHRT